MVDFAMPPAVELAVWIFGAYIVGCAIGAVSRALFSDKGEKV